MKHDDYFLKIYPKDGEHDYIHTTMVTHKGTIVAFAMDSRRRIYYSVLDLNQNSEEKGALDVNYWHYTPVELKFPDEIAQAGYAVVGNTRMPLVKKGSNKEADGTLAAEEKNEFLSTTARLTASAPFHTLSDGKYIYLFRQAIDDADANAVFALTDGTASGDRNHAIVQKDHANEPVAIVKDTLLVDRFILGGSQLNPPMEIRYRRSRRKDAPLGKNDTLGTKDMDGNYFREPTVELDFIRHLSGGRFSVLLVPTQVAHVERWQIFAYNGVTERIDLFSVERSANGLFDTEGTRFYTSPDPQFQSAVFERAPGKCPFTDRDLIPVVTKAGAAGSALYLDGATTFIDISFLPTSSEGSTIEIWCRPEGSRPVDASPAWQWEVWNHVVVANDGVENMLFINGKSAEPEELVGLISFGEERYIGRQIANGRSLFFKGKIDDVRIWNRDRDLDTIAADRHYRLAGNELGLLAYYRFDEVSSLEELLLDLTDNSNDTGIAGNPIWVSSDAPIGPHPGMHRTTLEFPGKSIAGGMSALLYYQQEKAAAGHNEKLGHIKQNARVMLAVTTKNPDEKDYIAAVDFGVHRDGSLAQIPNLVWLKDIEEDPEQRKKFENKFAQEAHQQRLEADIRKTQDQIAYLEKELPKLRWQKAYATVLELESRGAKFFERDHYQGKHISLGYKNRDIMELHLVGWNDRIVSITVDDGVIAYAWRHENRGDWHITAHSNLPGEWWSGQLSSILIEYTYEWSQQYLEARTDRDNRAKSISSADRAAFIAECKDADATKLASIVDRAKEKIWSLESDLSNKKHSLQSLGEQVARTSALYYGEKALPMDLIHTDPNGLTVAGGLLKFAYAQGTPILLDSYTGSVILYFRGMDDQFFAAYFDARCQKSHQEISLLESDAKVTAVARAVESKPQIIITAENEEEEGTETAVAELQMESDDLTRERLEYEKQIENWSPLPELQSKIEWLICVYEQRFLDEMASVRQLPQKLEWITAVLGKDLIDQSVEHEMEPLQELDPAQTVKKRDELAEQLGFPTLDDTFKEDVFKGYLRVTDSRESEPQSRPWEREYSYDEWIFWKDLLIQVAEQDIAAEFAEFAEEEKRAVENKKRLDELAEQLAHPIRDDDFIRAIVDKLESLDLLDSDRRSVPWPSAESAAATAEGYADEVAKAFWEMKLDGVTAAKEQFHQAQLALEKIDEQLQTKQEEIESLRWFEEKPATYTVTIKDAGAQIEEIWKAVPRRADLFAQILNGEAAEKQLIGSVALLEDGTATLLKRLATPVTEYATVQIGTHTFSMRSRAENNAQTISIAGDAQGMKAAAPTPHAAGKVRQVELLCDFLTLAAGESIKYVISPGTVLQIDDTQFTVRQRADSGATKIAIHPVERGTLARLLGERIDVLPYDGVSDRAIGTLGESETAATGHFAVLHLQKEQEPDPNKAQKEATAVRGRRIIPGAVLRIGEALLRVESVPASAAGPIRVQVLNEASLDQLAGKPIAQLEPVPVYVLPYDYAANATAKGSDLSGGSTLVRMIAPENVTAIVSTEKPRSVVAAAQPHWVANAPGRALHLDGGHGYKRSGSVEGLDAALKSDGITMEAWVKPSGVGDDRRAAVIEHRSEQHHLNLTLKGKGADGYVVEAGVGSWVGDKELIHHGTSKTPLSSQAWHHVAAVYHQGFALQFDGTANSHLKVPHAVPLDLAQDLTIEVFLRVENPRKQQGLLAKGHLQSGTGEEVPYALSINETGHLLFEFEDVEHKLHWFLPKNQADIARDVKRAKKGEDPLKSCSTTYLSSSFHKIAVTRERKTKTENKMGKPQDIGGKQVQTIESVDIKHWDEITFYMDGRQVGEPQRYEGADAGQNEQDLEIASVQHGETAAAFNGLISEVRLWTTALPAAKLGKNLNGREQGLTAWWQFQENSGSVTVDAVGGHAARLGGGVTWSNSPDGTVETGSRLQIYQDGELVQGEFGSSSGYDDWLVGSTDLTIGGRGSGSYFQGLLEEIRLWKTSRTQEQILDNMFGRLKGEREDLIACYSFDPLLEEDGSVRDEKMIHDSGLLGIDLDIKDAAEPYRISDAPIGTDTAKVRSALSQIKTDFQGSISSAPAVREYGDLQNDGEGDLQGVLKRCYGYAHDGQWHLITGYKVGNLLTEWIGQVQFDPQIIGYVEGAPPVPSENLTAGPKNPKSASYDNASSLEVIEADDVDYSFTHNDQGGLDSVFEAGGAYGEDTSVGTAVVAAPMGAGTATDLPTKVKVKLQNKGKLKLESSKGWSSAQHVSTGRNSSEDLKVALSGQWEKPGHMLNPSLGQRYQPANVGMALVRSETADVFALRLAHTGTLVSFRFLPNPDIPKDVNLIPFPINPRYTKQGTLDGRVGFDERGAVLDPDYPNARSYGQYSYFKPQEAYALKKRIEREEQRLATYYNSHGPAATKEIIKKAAGGFLGGSAIGGLLAGVLVGGSGAAAAMAAAGSTIEGLAEALSEGYDVASEFARQDIVNTYVWTASGGMYAESTSQSQVKQESVSSSFKFSGKLGGSMKLKVNTLILSKGTEMSGMLGGHFSITKSKSEKSKNSFSIKVALNVPGDLQRYEGFGTRLYDEHGQALLVPGKVDAYRFMTFYLKSSSANFEDLFSKVMDPIWLEQSDDANAKALREAHKNAEKKPPCWRVFHRVTFQSRILPEFPSATAPPLVKAMQTVNVRSNWDLLQKLKPFVADKTSDHTTFAKAVRSALEMKMPELAPHSQEITEMAAVYFEVGNADSPYR